LIGMSGYYLSQLGQMIFTDVVVPAFSLAFLVGIFVQFLLKKSKADAYVDKPTLNRITGSATDFLVVFGIASINLTVVAGYIWPLIILFAFGLVYCYIIFRFVSKRFFGQYWFERGLFTWGWTTGA